VTVLPVDYDGLSEQVIWLGTCSHAHGTVGAEGLPLGLSLSLRIFKDSFVCLSIHICDDSRHMEALDTDQVKFPSGSKSGYI